MPLSASPAAAAPLAAGDGTADAPDAALLALFDALSDGRPHRLDRLATALGTIAAPDVVRDALAVLQAAGVPVTWDDATARTPSFPALDAAVVRRELAAATVEADPAGDWDVRVVWATASTNSDLLDDARRGVAPPGRRLRIAETQRAGRGRLGRRWSSAPGTSLTMSVAVRVPRPLSSLDGVTLVCGLAVHRILVDHGVAARLKWPNDVLVDGAKLAGILVDAHASDGGTTLVVGVGVNVAPPLAGPPPVMPPTPPDTPPEAPTTAEALRATDLARAGAGRVDRNALAARLAAAIAQDLATFATTGFAPFAARWNAADAFPDADVAIGVASPEAGNAVGKALVGALVDALVGTSRGVDATGALLVETADGTRRIIAGDVSLRPTAPAS